MDDDSSPPSLADSFERALAQPIEAVAPLLPGTVVGERYEVIETLGAGGMGRVYLANDRDLKRKVALKHQRQRGGRDEALAMARLAHPNVVAVFEVGEHAGATFVAMEYVAGKTLRAWLAQGRSREAIVEALLAAGEGLVAAHEAKLVHRDFKPENVLVGDDGRVRVSDFGLAGDAGVASGAVGTPLYMAPEQASGGTVDARADQYAFCAVAWEALIGPRERPDERTTETEALRPRGALRARATSRLARVLERGLAEDPEARYPSLREVLVAMRGTRSRRRIAIASGAAALALAGGAVAVFAMRGGTASPSCEEAGAEIEALAPELAARLRELGAVDVAEPIAGFRARYREVAKAACAATQIERAWAPELGQRAQACLAVQRGVAGRLLAGEVTRATAPDLVMRAYALPDPAPCGNATVLASQPPLPARLDEVVAARAALEAALADASGTRAASLARAIAEVERSPVHAEPLVAARLDTARGVALHARDPRGGEELLARAYYASRGVDDIEGMLRVVAQLIESSGSLRYDKGAATNWLANGLADAQRARERFPRMAATVYLAAASIGDAEGEPAKAHEWLREAFALFGDGSASGVANASMVRASVHITEGKAAEAIEDYHRALALFEHLYGAEHHMYAAAAASAAQGMLALRRVPEARELMTRAADVLANAAGQPTHELAVAKMNVAALLTVDKQPDPARRLLESAREITVAMLGPEHPDVPKIDAMLAQAELEAGNHRRAEELARRAIAVMDRVRKKPHEDRGQAYMALCDAARLQGDHATAIRAAEASAEEYAESDDRRRVALWRAAQVANDGARHERALALALAANKLPARNPLHVAQANLEHARALVGLGRDRDDARRLLDSAEAAFSMFGQPAWVAEVDKARAQLR